MNDNLMKQAKRIKPRDNAFESIKSDIKNDSAYIRQNNIVTKLVASLLLVGAAIAVMFVTNPPEEITTVSTEKIVKVEKTDIVKTDKTIKKKLDKEDLFIWYASLDEDLEEEYYEVIW